MMLRLLVLLLGVLALREVQGTVWSEPVAINPKFPGQCHDHTKNKYYSVGALWNRPGECSQLSCDVDAYNTYILVINGVSCDYPSEVPPNCRLTTPSLSTRYPACCPKVKCDKTTTQSSSSRRKQETRK